MAGGLLLVMLFCGGATLMQPQAATQAALNTSPIQHVVLISIDGMHAIDLMRYVQSHPNSALAQLSNSGTTYTNASTSKPSNSFPGVLALTTGGSPVSTGVYYDNSYDRLLSAPGSNCSTKGTEVVFDESIDKNQDALDAGGGIDPAKLPRDGANGCTPVYPHSFLRVNTIFEVIKAAGGLTAWSDKHPAYDLLNGPSGTGVTDLYNPEINNATNVTGSVAKTEAYDDLKVQAVLNQLDGLDHTGANKVGVPAITGMNFQAISVGQKLKGVGYTDVFATPNDGLADALNHTDASIGKMLAKVKANGLQNSTMFVISAKHGQGPIDPAKQRLIVDSTIPAIINQVKPGLVAKATQDDAALIWLSDQSQTGAAAYQLAYGPNQKIAGISQILADDSLKLYFPDPRSNSRAPDIIVLPQSGVVYAGAKATKIAEHGGFSIDDTNTAILISNPTMAGGKVVKSPVQTMQVAPTILKALGLDPQQLQAVQKEGTSVLPGM